MRCRMPCNTHFLLARLKPALAAATSMVSVFFWVMNSLFWQSVM